MSILESDQSLWTFLEELISSEKFDEIKTNKVKCIFSKCQYFLKYLIA